MCGHYYIYQGSAGVTLCHIGLRNAKLYIDTEAKMALVWIKVKRIEQII